jgi:hypothetical protein
MQQVQDVVKSAHSEQEFQALSLQYQSQQQVIAKQTKMLEQHTENTNQQQLDASEQAIIHLKGELQRLKHLVDVDSPLSQQKKTKSENSNVTEDIIKAPTFSPLNAANEPCSQNDPASELVEYVEDDDGVITESIMVLEENKQAAVFDFSQYLHHQGSAELALFMLDDYTQDNHHQLNVVVDTLKAKDFDKTKQAIINLDLNAKILSAADLQKLCGQWLELLNGSNIPSNLKKMNALLKNTRTALAAIDGYAEII